MSRLIPFTECVARPPEDDKSFPLAEHLHDVGEAMFRNCPDRAVAPLYRLAGLCHDIYKAHPDWQSYVLSRGAIRKGPAHAAAGAFLFAWLAYHWLHERQLWSEYRVLWLRMAGDLADHHGKLDALTHNGRARWLQKYEWDRLDMPGIRRFLTEAMPDIAHVPMDDTHWLTWLQQAGRLIEEIELFDLNPEEPEHTSSGLMKSLQEWRAATTVMIAADRFSIHPVLTSVMSDEQAEQAYHKLNERLQQLAEDPLYSVRSEMQDMALERYRHAGRPQFVTVGLPTGYGKTLLSLRLAMDMVRHEGYTKIIYVAPYLSILEQTSYEMAHALGIVPLEHHSLAILKNESFADSEEKGTETVFNALMMESWAHPLVCTSFQQFCKALFPERAQHVLRRSWLKNSVIIIDEPQIFRSEGWNLLLTGLEAAAAIYRLKVIFLSATMPPMHFGLKTVPTELCPDIPATKDRYALTCSPVPMDQAELAKMTVERSEPHRAIILNTIRDAQLVFQALKDVVDFRNEIVRLLHGAMIPLHKKVWIEEIRSLLKDAKSRVTVVSTQVLEAGVDVSFQYMFRAAAILPSVVQAAGRVNRHAEGPQGTIVVRPFYRDGITDTRNYIYRQPFLRQLTDELLYAAETWKESELRGLLNKYFEKMFLHNSYVTSLQHIEDAYAGNWPVLGEYEPFESDALKLPVFVPWDVPEDKKHWTPAHYLYLLHHFKVQSSGDIYERYLDRQWIRSLTYEERKNFMILFHYHVVNIPAPIAARTVGRDDYLETRVPCLYGARGYDSESGWNADEDKIWSQFI